MPFESRFEMLLRQMEFTFEILGKISQRQIP